MCDQKRGREGMRRMKRRRGEGGGRDGEGVKEPSSCRASSREGRPTFGRRYSWLKVRKMGGLSYRQFLI